MIFDAVFIAAILLDIIVHVGAISYEMRKFDYMDLRVIAANVISMVAIGIIIIGIYISTSDWL